MTRSQRRVLEMWFDAIRRRPDGRNGGTALLETTESDLEFVRGLETSHGPSRALSEVRRRLEGRLAELRDPAGPEVDGFSEADAALLWERRAEIAELTLEQYSTIHNALREPGSGGVSVQLGSGD